MNKQKPNKKTNVAIVFEFLSTRPKVSRDEIIKHTKLTNDQVRQIVNRMLTNGIISLAPDEESAGVPLYVLHPLAKMKNLHGREVLTIAEEEAPQVKGPGIKGPLKVADIDTLGEQGEDHVFQQGYYRGYNDAMGHTQKDAYVAGKKVVIEGLLKLLKVDARVLMS